MPQHRSFEVESKDGLNVEISIDRRIQDLVEKEIGRVVEEFDPNSVSIIAGDPISGSILALANYPSFDPNQFNEEIWGSKK